MGIQLVAAPMRQMRTYTMWIGIFIGSYDALELLLKTFGDVHLLSPTAILAINAFLGFLIVPAKLILQNIPATTEQKKDIVAAAASQPMKEGQRNPEVKIDKVVAPSTPEGMKNEKS